MKHLYSYIYVLASATAAAERFRVMTFNTWNSGAHVHDGLRKIAKHVALVDPDIVALQEVQRQEVLPTLLDYLGKAWTGITGAAVYPDTAILSKHEILLQTQIGTNRSIGVRIALPSGNFVNFLSVHLDYRSYGPYAANNKLVTSMSQILVGEKPTTKEGRAQNIEAILFHPEVSRWLNKSDIVPVVLAGDFNTPSHIDWTDETRDGHGGWVIDWPATKIAEEMGFADSFRILHSNVTEEPGYTWSTVYKFLPEWEFQIPEPQDRIDFILYKGNIVPMESFLYSGTGSLRLMPDQRDNDFPSDHYVLVTDFEFAYSERCSLCS